METSWDYLPKAAFIARMEADVPSPLEQARNALKERNCQLSGWAVAEVADGGFQWIAEGELCALDLIHNKGHEEYEQHISVLMFTDKLPRNIFGGDWLDAAGTYYAIKSETPDGIFYKPAIITSSPRAIGPLNESRFEIIGEFYGWVRREPIDDAALLRPWIKADGNLFSKGRYMGLAMRPSGEPEAVHERVVVGVTAYESRCGDKDIPSLIANTAQGDVAFVHAAGRVFSDSGRLLLRHPKIYRNDAARERIDDARRRLYESGKEAIYGSREGLRAAS